VNGVVKKQDAIHDMQNGCGELLRFMPVFMPLEYDTELGKQVARTPGFGSRINSEGYGGILPLHLGLDGLFSSVRKSFVHGVLLMIDYHTYHLGTHNWNIAVNEFRDFRFGKSDIDFQIDLVQTIMKAEEHGLECIYHNNLGEHLHVAVPLLETFSEKDLKRGLKVHNLPFCEDAIERLIFNYAMLTTMADHWTVLGFKF